jgi:hypothetical protein
MAVITGMNVRDVKAGDNRVLTNLANGYTNAEFVGKYLSPFVKVKSRTGLVISFDKSTFRRHKDDRAPGGPYNIIEAGYESDPYSVKNKGLMYKVPVEHQEEAAQASINLGMMAQSALSDAEALNIELEQRDMAINPANYNGSTAALSGTDRFDDPTSTPGLLVRDVSSDTARKCGRRPNLILTGPDVTNALAVHPDVKQQFHQTNSGSITDDMLKEYFGLPKEGRYITGEAIEEVNPATGETDFIWGKYFILAYVNPAALKSGEIAYTANNNLNRITQPSKFYTYVLDGNPTVSNPFWDEFHDSWFYKIKFERSTENTGIDSGYLLSTVVS